MTKGGALEKAKQNARKNHNAVVSSAPQEILNSAGGETTDAYDSSSLPEELGERYVYLPDKATFVRVVPDQKQQVATPIKQERPAVSRQPSQPV